MSVEQRGDNERAGRRCRNLCYALAGVTATVCVFGSATALAGQPSQQVLERARADARVNALEALEQRIASGEPPRAALKRALGDALAAQAALQGSGGRDSANAGGRGRASAAAPAPAPAKGRSVRGAVELPALEVALAGERQGGRAGVAERERRGVGERGQRQVREVRPAGPEIANANADTEAGLDGGDGALAETAAGAGGSTRMLDVAAGSSSGQATAGRAPARSAPSDGYVVVLQGEDTTDAADIADLMQAYDYDDASHLEGTRVTIVDAVAERDKARQIARSIEETTGHEPSVRGADEVQSLIGGAGGGARAAAARGDTPDAEAGGGAGRAHGAARRLAAGIGEGGDGSRAQASARAVAAPAGGEARQTVYDVLLRADDASHLDALVTLIESSNIEDWFVADNGAAVYLGRFYSLEQAVERQRHLERRLGRLPSIEDNEVVEQQA